MERGYKYRIYPTPEQEVLIQKTFGCVRFVFNHFLALRKELYETEKKSLSYNECSAILTLMINIISSCRVYPNVMRRHLDEEMPFIATEIPHRSMESFSVFRAEATDFSLAAQSSSRPSNSWRASTSSTIVSSFSGLPEKDPMYPTWA